jgi:outer membrane protein OmpA-like peptidoglycan-associated protein
MVSGMLTAINDFVSDSFQRDEPGHEQNLDVIKTEDFSLLIKRGPQIMLVAAVTGNVPQHISTKLQLTLEQIHSLYADEISQFEGDTLPFEATRSQLQECLVAELKDESSAAKRKPWMAIVLVLAALAVALFFTVKEVQQYLLAEKLRLIDEQPGILVRQLHTHGQSTVQLHLLRDPNAIEVQQWLDEHQIESDQVEVEERAYLSLEPELVLLRIKELISRYPDVRLENSPQGPALSGLLNNANRQMLVRQLSNIPGIENLSQLVENIQVQELQTLTEDSPEILQALFQINSAKIDVTQIEFEQGKSELTKLAKQQISILSEQLKTIIDISQKLELNVGLIIMGASDSVGSKVYNQRLSLQRAQAVQAYLVELGIEPGYLNAIGLGVVEIQAVGSGARKVIFNIVDFRTQ